MDRPIGQVSVGIRLRSAFSWTVSAVAMEPVARNTASPNPARRMWEIVLPRFGARTNEMIAHTTPLTKMVKASQPKWG